jgi:hypothetical protein
MKVRHEYELPEGYVLKDSAKDLEIQIMPHLRIPAQRLRWVLFYRSSYNPGEANKLLETPRSCMLISSSSHGTALRSFVVYLLSA